mmetsp:Transcript_13863/g.16109  ORF Transcript_13863/g.16109 Transcript_13863/m.16109 type:complete len:219 (+) Transcript_13863:1708-2364(+)
MDIWGAGCVLFEIISLFPLFPGADEVDQINRIHKVVGTPTKAMLSDLKKHGSAKMDFNFREQSGVGIKHFIPHASKESLHLLDQTLKYEIKDRIKADAAVNHSYFAKIHEQHNEHINQQTEVDDAYIENKDNASKKERIVEKERIDEKERKDEKDRKDERSKIHDRSKIHERSKIRNEKGEGTTKSHVKEKPRRTVRPIGDKSDVKNGLRVSQTKFIF